MKNSIDRQCKIIKIEEEINKNNDNFFKSSLLKFYLENLHNFFLYKTKILNINDINVGYLDELKPEDINDDMIKDYGYYYDENLGVYITYEYDGNEILVKEMDKIILSLQNDVISYSFLYWLHNYYGIPYESYESCYPEEIFSPLTIDYSDIEKHFNLILQGENPIINYLFAIIFFDYLYLGKDEIKKLEKVILNSKNPELNYLFAKNFEYHYEMGNPDRFLLFPDIKEHEKIINDSNIPELHYLFVKNILIEHFCNPYIKDEIYNKLLQHGRFILDSKNAKIISLYARLLKMARVDFEVEQYRNAIIDSNDAESNYIYTLFFENDLSIEEFMRHKQIVLDSKNVNYNYLFAKDFREKLSKEDISKHRKIVLDSKNAEYNYLFAKDFKEQLSEDEIVEHGNIILASSSLDYYNKFMQDLNICLSKENIIKFNINYFNICIENENNLRNKENEYTIEYLRNVISSENSEELNKIVNTAISYKDCSLSYNICNLLSKSLSEVTFNYFQNLGQVILESGNIEYIDKLIKLILNHKVLFCDSSISFDLPFQKHIKH